MPVEQLQDHPLLAVALEEIAEDEGLGHRGGGLCESLTGDAPGERCDPLGGPGIPVHGPRQLVECEALLILTVAQRSLDDLRRDGIKHLDQRFAELRHQRVADVVPRLGLHPVLGLGAFEEGVEEGAELLGVLGGPHLRQAGLHEPAVLLLALRDPGLFLAGPAIRREPQVLSSAMCGRSLPVRQRREEPADGLRACLHAFDCREGARSP
jgi:hypothetical protein